MASQIIIGMLAESSIHVGADGSEEGAVDLPIQREGSTGWPVIFGSSLKGALRSLINNKGSKLEEAWFGNKFSGDSEQNQLFAGAMMVSDGRLLWIPIRSLTSHVKYVSCPALIQRFQRDLRRVGQDQRAQMLTPLLDSQNNIINETSARVFNSDDNDKIFLEEYRFEPAPVTMSPDGAVEQALTVLCELNHDIDLALMKKRFTMVCDDVFAHLCQAAIPVQPHIALDYETKTTRADTGALWYEESLPADTQLYSIFGFNKARNDSNHSATTLADEFTSLMLEGFSYLQIGANESTGMGWCRLKSIEQGPVQVAKEA